MKVNGQLLESRADAAGLFEPADALLDHGTTLVCFLIELHAGVVPREFVVFVRDDRLDAACRKPAADAQGTVPLVAGELPWLLASATFAGSDIRRHDRFQTRRVVDLPGRHFDRERSSRTVGNHVEL